MVVHLRPEVVDLVLNRVDLALAALELAFKQADFLLERLGVRAFHSAGLQPGFLERRLRGGVRLKPFHGPRSGYFWGRSEEGVSAPPLLSSLSDDTPFLKFLIAFPRPSPSWGSLEAPKMMTTIKRMIRSSGIPRPNM